MSPRIGEAPGLVPGTLDMLILRTLVFGPTHGRGIANHIRQTTSDVLSVEHGSLYPALHRLERDGLIAGSWEVRGDITRQLKYYRITPAGRKRLRREQSQWERLTNAVAQVMRLAEG